MNTNKIRNQINSAIAKDKKNSKFLDFLMDWAHKSGNNHSKKKMQPIVDFMYDYLRHVPEMSKAILQESQRANIAHVVRPLMEYIENYFIENHDVIPDHHGVIGLADDAYLALRIIQSLSDEYKVLTGRHLISLDLTSANNWVADFLGHEATQQLEGLIATAKASQMIQNPLGQLANYYNSTMYFNDPIWGTASINEVVDARLGAMGVV